MVIRSILFFLTMVITFINSDNPSNNQDDIKIQGIEPNSGPTTGETRVLVRMQNFNKDMIEIYPHPHCRFGSMSTIVNATYVKCSPEPRKVGEREPYPEEKTEICIQCENTKPHTEDIIPFTVSLFGDFTDTLNSVPYRFYIDPTVTWIYPRYGPKDGGTIVEVYGENFLNYDQNLRCAFGSREVKAKYVSDNYLTCITPLSDVVQKKLPFSISFNNQQNSKQDISFVYYEYPQVYRLEPNRGPDTGGTLVRIRGQNFNPLIEIPEMNNFNDTFCRFGNLSLTNGKVISSTEMDCVSPPSWEAREVPVEITLNNREWTNDGVLFYYYHPPFIYFINPKIGPVEGGTIVTITGSNFEDTGYVMCKFGDKYSKGNYINQNELKCPSPPVEKPATVNLYVAIRPEEFSSGINTKFRYYDNPIIDYIEPMCGPERGFTQITVKGKNFPVGYSEEVKCVFNRKIYMNATVMDDTTIKCDSPSVLNYEGINDLNITQYPVELTLNSIDFNGPAQIFYYYKETFITGLKPIFGPVTGNTTVNITGFDFNQTGGCNVKARFATYEVTPVQIEHNYMIVQSPKANFTGAVVVQVALNGKQFEKDITVNFRDEENTFYYYKCPVTIEMKPIKGPTIGGNEINLYGVGYDSPFYANLNPEERVIYYRWVDYDNDKINYSDTKSTIVSESHLIKVSGPNAYKNSTVARLQLSYNKQNFCSYNQSYTMFLLPNITSIDPMYGPLKSNEYQQIKVKLDNYYCTFNCDQVICRYRSTLNVFYEKGYYVGPNLINCTVPKVNIPESYNLEASFNDGEDFTNNGHNYTFYDPYVLKVIPQMVSSKGNTTINIYGYGFANSGKNLKVKYGSSDRLIKCLRDDCVTLGYYMESTNIQAVTYPRKDVIVDKTGEVLGFERFGVEVSVYNDDFTNNNVTIFYFDEPEIIDDLSSIPNTTLSTELRKRLEGYIVRSLPANLDTFIPIAVDASKILKSFKQIEPYTNYTCKYTVEDKNGKEINSKVTEGIFTSFPPESNKMNLFLCKSPEWEEVGNATVKISINGYDYSNTVFNMIFTDPISIIKVDPPCGPLEGKTLVQLYGTGFEKEKEYIFKWGPQNLVPMSQNTFLGKIKDSEMSFIQESKFPIEKIIVKSPIVPDINDTRGGLDYIAISKINLLPLKEFLSIYFANDYIHTNFEYYYYKQIYVESFSPSGSVMTGGTQVMVIGAWFQNKPQYGMKPYCQFGEKIVEGIYLSTVRILCTAPEYPKANVRVRFGVSLNKQDFVYAEKPFTYYNDFTHAKFEKIIPESGPSTGGTSVKIFGKNFTNMVTDSEFLCKFQPENDTMPAMVVPAQYREYDDNSTAILCNTPGGWRSGTTTKILITFDGQRYMDTNFTFFFYKIDEIIPIAGPNNGVGTINIIGGGFKNSSKVVFSLNHVDYHPLKLTPNKIVNKLPKMNPNFTGYVDMGLTLNGIDHNDYKDGFYYYIQPNITSVYPNTAPSKGHSKIRVFGELFRNDFRGANLGCKVGSFIAKGEFISSNEMICHFTDLPLSMEKPEIEMILATRQLKEKKSKNDKDKGNAAETLASQTSIVKNTYSLSIALNNVSFTDEFVQFGAYGVVSIEPSSGPSIGGTRILVKGAGFYKTKSIRCRFGVDGYYAYTEASYIDYNKIACNAPKDFKIPRGGELPFSVPFSIAFHEDEFSPWTETSHFFSFYKNPKIVAISPTESKTSETTTVFVYSDKIIRFAMPSATVVEEQYDVLPENSTDTNNMVIKQTTSFSYQPILCKFGRFGTTEGEYVNRTFIKCLTPQIADDSDIGYEDVELEIALNGQDFVHGPSTTFTFIGPNAGKMLWVYILIILFIAILIIVLVTLAVSYWNKITAGANVYRAEVPHVNFHREIDYIAKNRPPENLNKSLNSQFPRASVV